MIVPRTYPPIDAQDLPYEQAPDGAPDRWRLTRAVTFRWREPPCSVFALFPVPWANEFGSLRRGYDSDGAPCLWLTVMAGFHFGVSCAPDFRRALAGASLHDFLYQFSAAIAAQNRVAASRVLSAADRWFLAQLRASGFALRRTYFIGVRLFGRAFHSLFAKNKETPE